MTNKNNFEQVKSEHLPILTQYVPIVAKVHGKDHPEFHDVHKVFNSMSKKMKHSNKPKLEEEFKQLQIITNNYKVPDDVCESYEAVYKMLSELDQAYQE